MKEERERPPLRVILQNFINHVENLEAYRRENSYEKEFQDLKLFSENLKTVGDYSCKEGEKEINRKKNRYKDILPFDYTRVALSEYVGVPGSDYINANYIKGASGSPAYIASQGPLPHTVNDFWRMVVECEVQVIVMACNEEESGKHKCENYWVEKEGEEKKFGLATIRLLKASTICPDFLVRTMQLKYMNAQSIIEERVVCQFHYGAWPDHGVPGLVRPLLEMVRLVRDTQASETLPVLVHCSAGCGRTGTICAIDYVWGLLRAGKLKLDFSLFQLVRDMRKQRIAMVQTKDQYILVHQAVKELFQDQLRMIHSHPYENIDIRGLPIVPSLSSKAAILYPGKTTASEEKQDGREKESSITSSSASAEEATALASASDAPPLPHKKRIHIISSKQEKEVENLTQRQLAIASASGNAKLLHQPCPVKHTEADDREVIEKNMKIVSAKSLPTPVPLTVLNHSPMSDHACSLHQPLCSPLTESPDSPQKPSIAKLKALFESNTSVKEMRPIDAGHVVPKPRLPQLVTRSHSLGAVRKPQKFTQFTAGVCETGLCPPVSSDLCDSERYKSASNTHVDISCTNYKDVEMNLDTPAVNVESLSNSNLPSCVYDNGPESVPYYEKKSCEPYTSLPMVTRKSIKLSAVLVPPFKHENSSHATDIPPGMHIFPETPRPALPIKRSKSLKAKMSGETFKLSLSKRDHGQSQELPTSEKCSMPPRNLAEGKSEIKSAIKVSRGFESACQGDKLFKSKVSKTNVSVKLQSFQNSDQMEPNEPSAPVSQRADISEAFSSKVSINSGPSEKVGLISPSMKKSSIDSEQFLGVSEKKKVEYLNKPNCDVCRAQSLNLKREKSSHALKTFSQEGQYVNLKKFDISDSTKHAKEPLKYKVIPDKIGDSKSPLQSQNSLPIDASSVYEHCTNYLIAEGVEKPSTSESQRIAAVNARHKVDTVVGGLGIRERRNSFRRAVGQGIDDKSSCTVKTSKVSKWPPNSSESYSLPHPEAAPFKKQFVHLSGNSAMRRESEETLMFDPPSRELNERNKGAEGNVVFKSPPGVQKFPLVSDCKYVKGVQKPSENYGEASDVQKHNKLTKMTESSPISSDIMQKNVRSNKKTASDSSSFHNSNPSWMHSVGTGEIQAAHNPVMHNSNTSDALFSPSKSSTSKEAHLWPTQQYNNVPHKKGNLIDASHAVEMQSVPQLNPNLVVPLEVDVDQVGASMRHNFQEKAEGIKTMGMLENPSPGNSGASTHFIRALEVFQQTAASIRTKFSWSAGSGSNSPKSPEPSPKTSPVASSQPQLPKTHLNAGGRRKGERNVPSVSEKPKIIKKQQQYL